MKLKVAFLNCVSHGDCIVITFTDRRRKACIVVDGGKSRSSAKALADYLVSQKVKSINLMVGTHIDEDHINGLKFFVGDQIKNKEAGKTFCKIKEYWGPMPSEGRQGGFNPTSFAEVGERTDAASWRRYIIQSVNQNNDLIDGLEVLGTSINHPSLGEIPRNPFTSVKIDLLGPDMQIPANQIKSSALATTALLSKGMPIKTLAELVAAIDGNAEAMAIKAKRNANNQSIVFRLRLARGSKKAKAWTFLLTGDAEEEAWAEMLANSKVARKLRSRVVKLPHHGSTNGITLAGLKKVKPEYSVNQVGQLHGIPDKLTLQRVRRCKSAIMCTQRNASTKKTSACIGVRKAECPAYKNPQSIIFELDTSKGKCTINPASRACQKKW